jgi:CDP-diacylglycerol---glycerol-3-phosphate 3-phosphatidyltransferase
MNLPNKLTTARFGLTVLFVWALFFTPFRFHNTLALFLFNVAGFTDFLDGKIARSRGLITNFGILMDSLADKILTCSAFIAFVQSTHVNPDARVKVAAWMVIIIVAREFAITGMRLIAASKSIVLAAENFGKHKTVSQIAAINGLLLLEACQEWPLASQQFIQKWFPPLANMLLWLAVILTATSGGLYLWRNRALYLNDM